MTRSMHRCNAGWWLPWLVGGVLSIGLGCGSTKEPMNGQSTPLAAAAPSSPAAAADETPPPATPSTRVSAEPEPVEPEPPAWKPRPEDLVTPHHRLENPEALAPFFEALARIDGTQAQEVVRVVHLGASMIGADDLTSILRGRFQTRFGDGGAGLVLLQRYMNNYLHRWVQLEASGWKNCYIGYLCKKDGHYGLGGAVFFSEGRAQTSISTRKEELGDEVAHVEVWYAAEPRSGVLEARVDDADWQRMQTDAEQLEDRFFEIDVEQGPHTVQVRARGRVRGYGVVMETTGPGLVWDQFSMLGAFTKRMHAWNPEHIAGQIRQRDPALVAFTYGGNDLRRVALGKLDQKQYVREYLKGVRNVMAGKPEAACLIIGITDRGRSLTYEIRPEHVEVIVGGQREVARQAGCAFFDTYTAMGGGGSLRRWKNADPPLAAGDLKHLNHRGRVKLGGWIYDAIMAEYVAHRSG